MRPGQYPDERESPRTPKNGASFTVQTYRRNLHIFHDFFLDLLGRRPTSRAEFFSAAALVTFFW